MAKIIRTAEDTQIASHFECAECEGEFAYGPGFPDYCPECGAEITETYDAKEKRGGQ